MKSSISNSNWSDCRNILCIRADNLGDLLMSSPAIRALKDSFGCKITVLTSSMAAGIVPYIDCIDEVIVFDFPWVKKAGPASDEDFLKARDIIRSRQFDAAVIFTVYSQNPLPAAMLTYLAGVPKTLAYCRENPYELVSHWLPEKEPYTFIRHQVRRDLELVTSVGAKTKHEKLRLNIPPACWDSISAKLIEKGIDVNLPWIILHPGVSEEKRKYDEENWIEIGRKLTAGGYQVLLTGTAAELELTSRIGDSIGGGAFTLAGECTLGEFAAMIQQAGLVISLNTATAHLAAATGTPVIVLYALTNPQHLPWKARGSYFCFDVPAHARSKNEVIRYVHEQMIPSADTVSPDEVHEAANRFFKNTESIGLMPEMIPCVGLERDALFDQARN